MVYYLLVEKMYLFTNNVLHQLWSDVRLQVDYEVEMAFDFLRLIRRQINEGIVGFKGLYGVTTAQLVLLVYKVTVVFNKVNATKSRVTTAVRVSTTGWIKWLEDQDMRNKETNQVCEKKEIKREFSVARTPQQNRVDERKNRTPIEAARTMLADLKLPTTFWAEAVNIACYVQNRVLVIKPHNKTPYELFYGRTPILSFTRPFGCPVIILNTLDPLGKFDGKADKGFFVGYAVKSKEFRVFNSKTRIVEETLHINFLENKPNVAGSGPTWLFDIDTLIKSMNYKPVTQDPLFSSSSKDSPGDGFKPLRKEEKKDIKDPRNEDNEVLSKEELRVNQEKEANVNNTNNINIVSPANNAAGIKDNAVDKDIVYRCANDPNILNLEEIVYSDDDEDVGAEADTTNLDTNIHVSHILTSRIHKDHPIQARLKQCKMSFSSSNYKKFRHWWIYHMAKGPLEQNRSTKIRKMRGILVRNKARMNVKSAFLYDKIEKEVYVCQPLRFEDLEFPDRVYKVEKALYGLHQAPRAWKKTCTEFERMMHKKFQMSSMGKLTFSLGLQVTQKDDEIFISQDKSMIGSLMYLTSSRPDIMFTGQPNLGLWYPKDSLFDLEAYTDSDYAGASLDKKSTTGGCQFLRRRLISWQCKKQTVVANSTTEAEYVAASNCCGHVLWIQNQMLDYGYNFMNTKIFIDNESTICIVKNPFWATAMDKNINGEAQIHAKVDGKKVIISEATIRNDLKLEDEGAVDCLSNEVIFEQLPLMGGCCKCGCPRGHEKMYDSMEVAATTATGLDAEKDRGIICKTQFTATLNEPSFIGTSSGSGPRRQETIEDAAAQTRSERVLKFSNDPPLSRVTTLENGEDRLQLKELIELCIKLSDRVLDLEKIKTAQTKKISNLKKRVKRLERKKKSRSHGLKRLYKVGLSARVESSAEEDSLGEKESSKQERIEDIDTNDNITLVNDQEMFDADRDLQDEKVIEDITIADIEEIVSTAALITTDVTLDELTMAQALVEIKKLKPKGETTTTTTAVTIPTCNTPKLGRSGI
uniref:Uncharacterized protein n=1 Tax=Tanacetum cinerariifolium TaxID=118510 RepID=A0A6L2NIC6_TANCI|nr:hypothetical protein [Tanacetum cinerariifolium]